MNLHILNPLRWKKSFIFLLLIAFLVIWFGFLDTYSVWTRIKLSREKSQLKAKTELLKQKTDTLNQKISELKKNPDLIEKIAREKYGMRKKGETVYRVEVQK
ncbi:MAG TPA: septum formation initiator family protein [Balneolales bacterium]|nr:septum formation initiator family protein [Balneolales bacterium]